jgi:hypothetical protein
MSTMKSQRMAGLLEQRIQLPLVGAEQVGSGMPGQDRCAGVLHTAEQPSLHRVIELVRDLQGQI